MLEWFGALARAVISLGYPGVCIGLIIEGLGLPFPGDALLAFYGFAAAEGQFHVVGVVIGGIAGYITGAVAVYGLSRLYGERLRRRLERWPLFNQRSMMRATRLIDRYGPLLLLPGRFLPGVRSVSSYVAGIGGMALRPFLIYTVIGASIWCTTWVLVGYWFGEHMGAVVQVMQSSLAYILGIAMITVATVWLIRRRQVH